MQGSRGRYRCKRSACLGRSGRKRSLALFVVPRHRERARRTFGFLEDMGLKNLGEGPPLGWTRHFSLRTTHSRPLARVLGYEMGNHNQEGTRHGIGNAYGTLATGCDGKKISLCRSNLCLSLPQLEYLTFRLKEDITAAGEHYTPRAVHTFLGVFQLHPL